MRPYILRSLARNLIKEIDLSSMRRNALLEFEVFFCRFSVAVIAESLLELLYYQKHDKRLDIWMNMVWSVKETNAS